MIDYRDRIEGDIGRCGQFIQAVLASPPWCYTIGNADRGLPELVMVGIDPYMTMGMLNDAGTAMRTDGRPYVDGEFLTRIASMPMRVDVVHPTQIAGRMQQSVYRESRLGRDPALLGALQLVWPDRSGRFPGEAGYDESFAPMQPLLSRPYVEEDED